MHLYLEPAVQLALQLRHLSQGQHSQGSEVPNVDFQMRGHVLI